MMEFIKLARRRGVVADLIHVIFNVIFAGAAIYLTIAFESLWPAVVLELISRKIPVVTPPGGLGCHLNAMEFLPHVSQTEYTAGALAAAVFIAGGIRGMERGKIGRAHV